LIDNFLQWNIKAGRRHPGRPRPFYWARQNHWFGKLLPCCWRSRKAAATLFKRFKSKPEAAPAEAKVSLEKPADQPGD